MIKRANLLGAALAVALGGIATAQSANPSADAKTAVATFAGGCFWSVEAYFDKVEGVLSTTSGYTGGNTPNPSYGQVTAGNTGHAEAVRVVYDPAKVSYAKLLEAFWLNHDPLTKDRQFCDAGSQYRAEIFYHDEEQQRLADASKTRIAASGRFKSPIRTEITPAGAFYPAADQHQDFHLKNASRYQLYRWGCGRDRRLKQLWGDAKETG